MIIKKRERFKPSNHFKTLFINTPLIRKMYKGIRKKKEKGELDSNSLNRLEE